VWVPVFPKWQPPVCHELFSTYQWLTGKTEIERPTVVPLSRVPMLVRNRSSVMCPRNAARLFAMWFLAPSATKMINDTKCRLGSGAHNRQNCREAALPKSGNEVTLPGLRCHRGPMAGDYSRLQEVRL
jgi:hypothetical protein